MLTAIYPNYWDSHSTMKKKMMTDINCNLPKLLGFPQYNEKEEKRGEILTAIYPNNWDSHSAMKKEKKMRDINCNLPKLLGFSQYNEEDQDETD